MMYAASSRRSTVRIQRQTSSRESQRRNSVGIENIHNRPSSSSSNRPARPNTANSFRPDRRPSTPYKSNSNERVKQSRGTFMLADEDLDNFHRAFCYMAKSGDFSPTAPTPKRDRKKKKTKKAKAKAEAKSDKDTTLADFLEVDTGTTPPHPWEETDASKIRLSISDFFATFQLSHISNGGFLDGIFELVGTNNLHAMTFGEFLDGICTFAMFKLDDMIRFIFFILDKDKNGRIPRFQVLRFVQSIHAKKILAFEQAILPNDTKSSNTKEDALKLPTAERQKATVDYQGLKKLSTDYPTMFEPMLLFQSTLRRRVLGEAWWRRKENQIDKHFRTMGQRREKNRKTEEKRLLTERKDNIIADIGRIPYYLRIGKSRKEAEEKHPKPIVTTVEETSVFHIEWTRTDGKDILDEGSAQTG